METIANAVETGLTKLSVATTTGRLVVVDAASHPRYAAIRDVVMGGGADSAAALATVLALFADRSPLPDQEVDRDGSGRWADMEGGYGAVVLTHCGGACPSEPHRHAEAIRLTRRQVDPGLGRFLCGLVNLNPHRPDVWGPHLLLVTQLAKVAVAVSTPLEQWLALGLLSVAAGGHPLLWATADQQVMSAVPTHGPPAPCHLSRIDFVPNAGTSLQVVVKPIERRAP